MRSEDPLFWKNWEKRAIDVYSVFFESTPESEGGYDVEPAIDFIESAVKLHKRVKDYDPSVLFIAERCAVPYDEVLRVLDEINGLESEDRVHLPVGTATDIYTDIDVETLSPDSKRQILEHILLSGDYSKWFNTSRVLVFDEVISGQSLSILSKLLVELLPRRPESELPIKIIGLEERSFDKKRIAMLYNRDKQPEYDGLIDYEVIPTSLVFTDRRVLLDDHPYDKEAEDMGIKTQFTVKNIAMRNLIRVITKVYLEPRKYMSLLKRVESGEIYFVDLQILDDDLFKILGNEDYKDKRWGRTHYSDAINWLKVFSKKIIEKSS